MEVEDVENMLIVMVPGRKKSGSLGLAQKVYNFRYIMTFCQTNTKDFVLRFILITRTVVEDQNPFPANLKPFLFMPGKVILYTGSM